MKNLIKLFIDGSVNPQSKIGFAAYLLVNNKKINSEELVKNIKLKKFENTSSTKLELDALLWALNEIKYIHNEVQVFTDCQNILGLKKRRKKFEQNNYKTSKNILISNHMLYKKFYIITDSMNCEFIKVKGHKLKSSKDEFDKIFSLVDKASRNALRCWNFDSR